MAHYSNPVPAGVAVLAGMAVHECWRTHSLLSAIPFVLGAVAFVALWVGFAVLMQAATRRPAEPTAVSVADPKPDASMTAAD